MDIPPLATHCDDCRSWKDAIDEARRIKAPYEKAWIRAHKHLDHWDWQIYTYRRLS